MRRTFAIARRILSQFAHDKRTVALLLVAPLVVLWLLSVLLNAEAATPVLALVDVPDAYRQAVEAQDADLVDADLDEAEELLRAGEVDAVLYMDGDDTLVVWLDGSDQTVTASCVSAASSALADMRQDLAADAQDALAEAQDALDELADNAATLAAATGLDLSSLSEGVTLDVQSLSPIQDVQTAYLHGGDDWKMFDFYGPIFIGVFLFAFTFLTSGMSLVNERSAGTMTRFLATPVRPVEVLGGYSLGFGVLALVQSAIILVVAIGVLGFPNEGALWLVVFVSVSMALTSVTMGLLVSGLARNAFQVIQLILLFVVPQVLLCGLFDLSGAPGWLQALSRCMPVTYGIEALRAVMLRGAGPADVALDVAVVWCFIVAFFVLAAVGFRKKRAPRAA